MKVIQSFWILPGDNSAGGWISKRYEFISWSLSYILLKKNFGKVTLNTNLAGAIMLTETLGLAYDEVNTGLENETERIKKAWVLGKMHSYAVQDEPFVHVDGDVFWFTIPDEAFFKAGVLAQNIEMDETAYKCLWLNIQKHAQKRLPCMDTPYSKLAMAANMGIAGGTDNEIYKAFYQDVLTFVNDNAEIFAKYKEEFRFINIYLEQALFLSYLSLKNQKPAFLKKPVFRTNFEEVTDFDTLDPQTGSPDFIHLLATFKYRIQYCNQMEFRLHEIWPEQLERIDRLCSDKTDFSRDFRILLDPLNEKKLPVAERIFTRPEDALNHPYIRSGELLKMNIHHEHRDITEIIHASADPEKARDCYDFETSRQNVLKYLLQNTNQKSLFRQLEKHRSFCMRPVEEVLSYKIAVNQAMCLKSTYNWFNDLIYNAKHYRYKMTLSSDGICFQELLLTETECEILDLLEQEMTIGTYLQRWCDNHEIQLNQKTITTIHKALKAFLALDLIILTEA